MTGPEHYAEAERLLAHADSDGSAISMQIVAEAQVHATLALAAATAAGRETMEFDPERGRIEGVITVADGWAALA